MLNSITGTGGGRSSIVKFSRVADGYTLVCN
jgi:hypothetical protein